MDENEAKTIAENDAEDNGNIEQGTNQEAQRENENQAEPNDNQEG